MKSRKIILSALVVVCCLCTSCLKDGLKDFDALRHPMHLTGTFNPTYGLPLGYAEVDMQGLLTMFKQSDGYIRAEDGWVTLVFDSTIVSHIDINSSKKAEGDRECYNYTASGSLNIDIFKNIENLPDTGDIKIKNLYTSLLANIRANMDPTTVAMVQRTGTEIYFDSIRLLCRDKYGSMHPVVAIDSHFIVHDFEYGTDIPLFKDNDIKDVINLQPNRLSYSLRVNISIPSDSLTLPLMSYIGSHLGFHSLDVTTHISLDFPITAYINNLSYNLNIEMSPSDALEKLTIDTSVLILEFENSMPFEFDLSGNMQDKNGNTLCALIDDAFTLQGGKIGYNSSLNNYAVVAPQTSTMTIPLNREKLEALKQCYNIQLSSKLRTSKNMDTPPAKPEVTVGADNRLKAKAYARLSPIVDLDVPLHKD